MIMTKVGIPISDQLLHNYFSTLVNCFFKILPIRESEEASLTIYMTSLQSELIGCGGVIQELNDDARFLRLIAILQYLIDNPGCQVQTVKREVFKAIRICEQLGTQYGGSN